MRVLGWVLPPNNLPDNPSSAAIERVFNSGGSSPAGDWIQRMPHFHPAWGFQKPPGTDDQWRYVSIFLAVASLVLLPFRRSLRFHTPEAPVSSPPNPPSSGACSLSSSSSASSSSVCSEAREEELDPQDPLAELQKGGQGIAGWKVCLRVTGQCHVCVESTYFMRTRKGC